MVTDLDKIEVDYVEQRLKHLVHRTLFRELHDFVTNNTYKLFTDLDIKTDFLTTQPKTWLSNNEYIDDSEKIKKSYSC